MSSIILEYQLNVLTLRLFAFSNVAASGNCIKSNCWEFLHGPVVRTWHFHCPVCVLSLVRELRFHKPGGKATHTHTHKVTIYALLMYYTLLRKSFIVCFLLLFDFIKIWSGSECGERERWKGKNLQLVSQLSSVGQLCLTFCDAMDCSTTGLPVHHQVLEFTQTHVHWVCDAIQPSYPLSSPSPPAFNLSQHQGLFKWVSSSHQVSKVLEFQLQHQSFQWTPRTDLL